MATTNKVDRLETMETARLNGKWEELRAFVEKERRRQRAAGRNKAEAIEEAWRTAKAKFPPALGNYFRDFEAPPSLIHDDRFRVAWFNANNLAQYADLLWELDGYEAIAVVKATLKRREIDPNAEPITPELFDEYPELDWSPSDVERFTIEAAEIFATAAQGIVGRGRLRNATRREIAAWVAFLPVLATVAKAQEEAGDVPSGGKQSEYFPF